MAPTSWSADTYVMPGKQSQSLSDGTLSAPGIPNETNESATLHN